MDSEEHLARRVLDIIPLAMRAMGAEIRQQATTGFQVSHFRVLKLIRDRPRTLSELATCQVVGLPTMSRTVSALVERGWVARTEDPRDRRRVQLRITDAGEAAFRGIRSRAQERLSARLATLTANERERLLAGLEVLEKVFATEVKHERD
jgi:DNA-binding MarR family transcriptional regulator